LFSSVLSAVEGVEAEGVRFYEATALTEEDVAAIQRKVRTRVLRLFKRRGPRCPSAYLWAMMLARIYESQAQGRACLARRATVLKVKRFQVYFVPREYWS